MDYFRDIICILFALTLKQVKDKEREMGFMQQDVKSYYPTKDETKLLQDILDFISIIYDVDAHWYCNDDFLDFFCSKLREGYPVQARFEKDGKLYVTYAWVEIKDDVIDVFIGNSEKEVAVQQVFKNYHPFEYGKYGVVDLNN